jgi:hypothetical protein
VPGEFLVSKKKPDLAISGEPEDSDLPSLARRIADIHNHLFERATKAVNVSLTLRNWLIGLSIQNYELEGKDRATYGDRLFSALASDLTSRGVSNCSPRQLYRYRDFYLAYPHIVGTLSPQLLNLLPEKGDRREIVGTLYPKSGNGSQELLQCLSYSHFQELVAIEDPKKRSFYEGECVRGNWSVRELQRQIGSLYMNGPPFRRIKNASPKLSGGKPNS